ncbi:hypothetical protein ABS767_12530 [Sphingomonas sp. ST-64]|uniref:Membrane-anchored ribosome-binding protein, inhibits growth in stationary phase, ElaB/YqjD/DUF883 family n=1 Tax=Sphingomonas plantiphila TaxID=3163295 RepID=A0ABW8YNJ2_9SPHN
MADENFPQDTSSTPASDTLVASEPLKGAGTAGDDGKRGAGAFVREEASKFAGQAGDKARSFADTGKEKATGALDEFSTMMRDAAGSVDERLGEQYGQYARSAADQISGLADSLRGKQVDDLLDDAREFVKKSPAVAVGIAAGVGFVLARLLKSGLDAAGDLADKGDTSGDPGVPKA